MPISGDTETAGNLWISSGCPAAMCQEAKGRSWLQVRPPRQRGDPREPSEASMKHATPLSSRLTQAGTQGQEASHSTSEAAHNAALKDTGASRHRTRECRKFAEPRTPDSVRAHRTITGRLRHLAHPPTKCGQRAFRTCGSTGSRQSDECQSLMEGFNVNDRFCRDLRAISRVSSA